MLVYDVNVQKTFENLDNWRDEFLIQASLHLLCSTAVLLLSCIWHVQT